MQFVICISYSSIVQSGEVTVEKHYVLIPYEWTDK